MGAIFKADIMVSGKRIFGNLKRLQRQPT